jgi:F0F1-type ATP synthase assembly protein I
MLDLVFKATAWGLLTVFAGFLVYGFGVGILTLVRFYRAELSKHLAGRNQGVPTLD